MKRSKRLKYGLAFMALVVVAGLAIILSGLIDLLEPRYRAMTVFSTSIEGLSVGSRVKYLGIPVGRITGLAMRESDGYVAVYFDIYPAALERDLSGHDSYEQNPDHFAALLAKRRMTCFVNAAGIIGGADLELTERDTGELALPGLEVHPPPGVSYVPARFSNIGNAIRNISVILEGASKVDFPRLGEKLDRTLDQLNVLMTDAEFRETLTNLHHISGNLSSVTRKLDETMSRENYDRINDLTDNLNELLVSLNRLGDVPELAALLRNVNEFLTETVGAIHLIEAAGPELGEELADVRIRLEQSLNRWDNTFKQLLDLANTLADDPTQIIRGRQEPAERP